MELRRYLVAGEVQGVGFRNYTCKKAQQIGVRGWVRNLQDGRVEALAQGSKEQLSDFEQYLKRGPQTAKVTVIEVFEDPGQELKMSKLSEFFEIRWGLG